MAIKTLNYTVLVDGTVPNYERPAGVRYDHNKTQLQFTVDSTLYNTLLEKAADGKLCYRFDCYDGEGKLHLGVTRALDGEMLAPYSLSYWVTKFGGKIKVCLVITLIKEDIATTEFSTEVSLSLDNLPESDNREEAYKSLSSLSEQTAENANTVAEIRGEMIDLHSEISEMKTMFENGEWVFDSNTDTEINVNFAIDNTLNLNSQNAVANNAVTQKFNLVEQRIDDLFNDIGQSMYDSVIAQIRAEVLLAAYPVGTYYWSTQAINPQNLFGGVWEQVKDVFVLAAGDEYAVGTKGGEAKHKLTANEMPRHSHGFKPDFGVQGIDFMVPTVSAGTGGSSIKKQESLYHPGHWASKTWGTAEIGGSMAHNNMPPYLTAYCFKRIG